jgi:hypothetical protein
MDKTYRRGLMVGLLGPLVFAGGILYWVYRYTHKIPFPVSSPAQGELVIGLVEPSEAPGSWAPWRQALLQVRDRFVALADEHKSGS